MTKRVAKTDYDRLARLVAYLKGDHGLLDDLLDLYGFCGLRAAFQANPNLDNLPARTFPSAEQVREAIEQVDGVNIADSDVLAFVKHLIVFELLEASPVFEHPIDPRILALTPEAAFACKGCG